MKIAAGADGCKGGWICLRRQLGRGRVRPFVFEDAAGLIRQRPRPAALAVDIPIGLTEAGPRACDRAARALLGWPRRNSVFPAPVRPALHAGSRLEASQLTQEADGRKVGAQAWGIYAKVRDVDTVLAAHPALQRRVREVHPEVSFREMNGGHSVEPGKKTLAGRARRLRLVEAWFGAGAFERVRVRILEKDVAADDILDAYAALWTAERILRGEALMLPADPPVDPAGLRMEIVY